MLSVIIPIYNAEKYLDKCINSIINQTYSNLEIILINDGSLDNSLTICRSFKESDRRIKLINQENQGVVAARNTGIRVAKGDYLTFVDSDDYIENTMYERMIDIINRYYCDIVMCDCAKEFDGFSQLYTHNIRPGYYSREQIEGEYFPHLLISPDINYPATISNCTCIFKNDEYNRLYYIEGIRYSEDWIFGAQKMYKARSFYYLKEEALYHYNCKNQNSVTHKFVKNKWVDYEKLYFNMCEQFSLCKEYDFSEQLDKVLLFLLYNAVGEILSTDKISDKEKIRKAKEILSKNYVREMFARCNICKLPISSKLKTITYLYKTKKGLKLFLYYQNYKRRKMNGSW